MFSRVVKLFTVLTVVWRESSDKIWNDGSEKYNIKIFIVFLDTYTNMVKNC